MELDPIMGKLLTRVNADMFAVAVPVTAVDALKNPESDFAGLEEVVAQKFLSGNPVFGLENVNPISDSLEITPRSIGGVKKVDAGARIAHAVAVNFLRRERYVDAQLVDATLNKVTPAIIGETVLNRFNAVLDPDDKVNGAVPLELPSMSLPVAGIGLRTTANAVDTAQSVYESTAAAVQTYNRAAPMYGATTNTAYIELQASGMRPAVYAKLNGAMIGNLSQIDFRNAKVADDLTRTMRQIVDENPQYGQEMVLRWAHAITMDDGKNAWMLADRYGVFGRDLVTASDTNGLENELVRSDMALNLSFTAPVPKSELGYYIITFLQVRPEEVIPRMPHPILSDNIQLTNYVAEELRMLDPQPVTFRELDEDCGQANESTRAFYTGLNQLRQNYVQYGLSRRLDPETVENKTIIWQYEIPLSVGPETILYPEGTPGDPETPDLNHYPFGDQFGEVVTYSITSMLSVPTPMRVGATPVEKLVILDDENIFEGEI